MTFIANVRRNRTDAPFVLDGPLYGEAFRTCAEHVLVSTMVSATAL